MKLTNTKVKSLPVPTDKGQVFHWDSETRGFGLRITSANVIELVTFIQRYHIITVHKHTRKTPHETSAKTNG